VVATANNIDSLPPEFMRKGRFDEIFFVDLPTAVERRAIWTIQLASNATAGNGLAGIGAGDIEELVAASENYSGAEIEQAVIVALYEAFAERRPATLTDLTEAITNMIPLAVTQAEEVQTIRDWAEVRAVRATGSEDIDPAEEALVGAIDTTGAGLSSRRGGRTVDF
jgi:SpoVK/Ycf46/Vps4 family AAA+-type ATPase